MIDPNRVTTILLDCLAGEDAREKAAVGGTIVSAEAIRTTFVFDQGKLAQYREEIIGMLDQLPPEFFDDYGGGWSFLQMCQTAKGELWTGVHQTMDELCALAIGSGLGAWLMPREFWAAMPGGMPYIVLKHSEWAGKPEPV